MDLEAERKASDLRAEEKIKAPDAIQIATAIVHGATGFLTNDRIFAGIKGIEVLILDKLFWNVNPDFDIKSIILPGNQRIITLHF